MRYVVYGAGGIGGTIGGRLHQAGFEVALIARGRHREVLEHAGLRLQTPAGDHLLRIPIAGSAAELRPRTEDIVFLTVKSQDTRAAVNELAAASDPGVGVICAQNGVENERVALRHFPNTYAMLVYLAAQHLEPGTVQAFAAPAIGVLDLGRAPEGADERARRISADLERAGFVSRVTEDIMRFKYTKLLDNLGNAVDALLESSAPGGGLEERAREEALRCYEAAGISCASDAEMSRRTRLMSPTRAVGYSHHQGSSSWQSLVRGTGATEADYLNGEIALLGRQYGVDTPVNVALQRLARAAAHDRRQPRSLALDEIERELT